ncbi:hypothetical protein L1987_46974 [Smallanthus sonchifolius]|uniref:Uncharacterized protein n=1 Tax=Smallanthus sonchifolius TaxID=185202 RepID=A0ACB9G1X0_9ASTR|nr:hypothetical protein L1987_46974 [Smallanthus sonchifolius]
MSTVSEVEPSGPHQLQSDNNNAAVSGVSDEGQGGGGSSDARDGGEYLAVLPPHPKLGKMLIMGAFFRYFDPILTIVVSSLSSHLLPITTFPTMSFTDFLDNIIVNFPPQSPVLFTSGPHNSSSSGSENGETNQWEVNPTDESRKKRMISNRESARRSRKRKQKYLEDIKSQVTQYKTVNRQLMNRLRFTNHNGQIVQHENKRLRLESVVLQQKLYYLHQLLAVPELHHTLLPSAWPCNNNIAVVNGQNQHPLIKTI